ncbi:hypothetical protein EXIGLDRAFT_244425 [Exidia glandulosa HHB12029]|uniref:F-box domain-containing protein n=1 Tax=Exidia glandulosa HHB12029 TaxID=1314781 RepID=A0A165Q927_EXIGL|nr:hypothetical protein EXIGLDRAFT_244425 [Exidia glandulosa HHB12029]
MGFVKRSWRALIEACVPCLSTPQHVEAVPLKHAGTPTPEAHVPPPAPRPMHRALLVFDIVSSIASYLGPRDAVAFARTGNATVFQAAIHRVWEHLPSVRALVPLLPAAGEITPSRWSLYAPLVTSLVYDEDDPRYAGRSKIPWSQFQDAFGGRPVVLPRLARLVWRSRTARGALGIVHFIKPDSVLQRLDIGLSDYLDTTSVQDVLNQLASCRLRVTTCKLYMLEDAPLPTDMPDELFEAVASFFQSIETLEEAHLSSALLSPSVLNVLGMSATLSSLTIIGRNTDQTFEPRDPQVEAKLPFRSLKTLETFQVGLSVAHEVLHSSRLASLSRIRVWTTFLPSVDDMESFIASAALVPRLEELLISVNAVVPVNHARYDYELPPTALHPLWTCERLSILELHLIWPTRITEEDVLQMALSWPLLRVLRLSGLVGEDTAYRSRLPLRCLLSLADHCRYLESLQLDINADLTGIDMDALRTADPALRPSIRVLDVGFSWWPPEGSGPSAEDVGDFLSDLFPNDYFRLLWDNKLPTLVTRRWGAVRDFLTPLEWILIAHRCALAYSPLTVDISK